MTNEATKLISLGKNISKFRKAKGFTQNELADILNISREHIAKIETAKRTPSLDLIFEISNALNITEKELFDFN